MSLILHTKEYIRRMITPVAFGSDELFGHVTMSPSRKIETMATTNDKNKNISTSYFVNSFCTNIQKSNSIRKLIELNKVKQPLPYLYEPCTEISNWEQQPCGPPLRCILEAFCFHQSYAHYPQL